jgi:hypothetical protein
MKRPRPPAPELLEFLAAFDAKIAELALAIRAKVIAIAPTANETDWDAYNAVSIGFHYTPQWHHGSFCHIAVYAKHVNLGFNEGASLDDPAGVLQGKGASIRHITLRMLADVDASYVEPYLRAAIQLAGGPIDQRPETTVRRMKSGRRRPKA